jgi:spore coat protein U-like protein
MNAGADRLDYNLYVDLPRTRVWGDGTGGTDVVARSVAGIIDRADVPIYGRVSAGQTPAPGSYGDGLLVTVVF